MFWGSDVIFLSFASIVIGDRSKMISFFQKKKRIIIDRKKFRSSELIERSAGYISCDEQPQYVPKIVEISFTWILIDCNLCSAMLDLHMEKKHEWKL